MKSNDLLIPVRRTKSFPGRFNWGGEVVLCSPFAEDQLPLGQLAEALKKEAGARVRLSRNYLEPYSLLVRRHNGIANLEGYRITVSSDNIEILASTAAGAYYAIQTLKELVCVHGRTLPCCRIDDEPDFWRRGIYLDCSRGKVPTVQTLRLLVEYLASLKVNELQLYVENVFTFKSHPKIGRGFSPFTPAELLAVQDHCKLHHIRFVPSLTSFGHFERILGLPEYRHLSEMHGTSDCPGGTTLCPGDSGSINLVADMYGDFLPLFEAIDFNACGDEPWELGKGRSKRRAERVGTGRVYLEFIKKLNKLCVKHGKRMNLWSDIVLNHPEVIPEIPDEIVMLNWDYGPKGARIPRTHEFVDAGLDVVVCPGTSGWQSHGTRLQNAIDNVSVFAQIGRDNNALGLLNTDWGDGGHRNPLGVSFHGYAHGAAHAWNGRAVDDAKFTQLYCRHVLGTTSEKVARLIRNLGSVEATTGSRPYHVIGEGINPARSYTKRIPPISPLWVSPGGIESADESGCRAALADLRTADKTVGLVTSKHAVARLVAEDLALAARLDRLGCRKALTARRCRAGKSVSSGALRRLAGETQATARAFQKNWLKRNKQSRLNDNLQLFKQGCAECLDLASR